MKKRGEEERDYERIKLVEIEEKRAIEEKRVGGDGDHDDDWDNDQFLTLTLIALVILFGPILTLILSL